MICYDTMISAAGSDMIRSIHEPGLQPASMTKKPVILAIEDVDLNLDLLVQLLEDRYEVVGAADGETGLRMAEDVGPDLILMDLALPGIDGWEATRRLRASATFRQVPIIALSSHAFEGDREQALAAGCDDYIAKPLDEGELFDKIEHHLTAFRARMGSTP